MEQESLLIQQLRRSLSRMEAAMGTIHDALAITDQDGKLIWCNDAFERLCSTSRLQCLGQWIGQVLPPSLDGQPLISSVDLSGNHGRRGSRIAMLHQEPLHVIELQWDPIVDEDPPSTVFCAHDISALISYQQLWARSESIRERNKQVESLNASLQQAQLRLAQEIRQCPVTGLPNRRALMEHLEQAIQLLQTSGRQLAVLFCDVNRFKEINDSHGHEAGDAFLIEISRRLRDATRQGDLISRLGGDEFVIVSSNLSYAGQAQDIASRIQESVGRAWAIGGEQIHPSLSIGIAIARNGEVSSTELLRRADLAMYAAKGSQELAGRFFDDGLAAEHEQSQHILQALRQAVGGSGLELHLQPIRHLATDALIGHEALVRLRGPTGELIRPALFIPHAEKSRLISRLGDQVLQLALRHLREDLGESSATGSIAINVSPLELIDAEFSSRILKACATAEVDPARLQLDITETALLSPSATTAAMLATLRQEGVKFLLDDFGTGYSSFSLLSELPLDGIKIDGSFTAALGRDPRRTAMIESAIQLCRTLGLTVIAEGIENEQQRQLLLELNCDYGQGYLLGGPSAP